MTPIEDSFSTIAKSTWEAVHPFESFPRSHQIHYAWVLRGKWKYLEMHGPRPRIWPRAAIYTIQLPWPTYPSPTIQAEMDYLNKGRWHI